MACTVLAHVKRPDGKIVQSKLFKDLLHFTDNNRKLSKKYYAIGTNENFLNTVRDRATFDENGEITLASLKEIANIDISENGMIEKLNAELEAGEYSYQDAVRKVVNFNKNNPFRKSYLANISQRNGKFYISVVKNTTISRRKLYNEIKKQSLKDQLIYSLASRGVNVSFLENQTERWVGKYDTTNPEQMADGLYNLIEVISGETEDQALIEEAGHFAVGMMNQSPLRQRLLDSITPEVVEYLIENNKNHALNVKEKTKVELAGLLVAEALKERLQNSSGWANLSYRISNFVKTIIAKIKKDDISLARLKAERVAFDIAKQMEIQEDLSEPLEYSAEDAIKLSEILYDQELTKNEQAYGEIIAITRETISRLRNILGEEISISLNDILTSSIKEGLGTVRSGIFSEIACADGIVSILESYLDKIGPGKEINRLLEEINVNDDADFLQNWITYSRNINQVIVLLNGINSMIKAINDVDGKIRSQEIRYIKYGVEYRSNIDVLIKNLTEATSYIQKQLEYKEKCIYMKFLEEMWGKKSVKLAAKIIFRKGKLKKIEERNLSLEDILSRQEEDNTWFQRWLQGAFNRHDISAQLMDKAIRMFQHQRNQNINYAQDRLREFEASWKNIKWKRRKYEGMSVKDPSVLYERIDGKLTGNIISSVYWGKWEEDYEAMEKEAREEFRNRTPDFDIMSSTERAIEWHKYFNPIRKQWHKDHSVYDETVQNYVPSRGQNGKKDYTNYDFEQLIREEPEFYKWYCEFRDFKDELDANLPDGSTFSCRMPQFNGRFSHRMRNMRQHSNTLNAIRYATHEKITQAFFETVEDADTFGSSNTIEEDDMLFDKRHRTVVEEIRRVPLYGINKLKKMDNLSTDIFQSTLAYASMAYNFSAMSSISSMGEIGLHVNMNKQIAGKSTFERLRSGDELSKSQNDFLKLLQKNLYSRTMKRHKVGKLVWEKFVSFLSALAGFSFLGGNIQGGFVNLHTGFNEILKESLAGEFFDIKDFAAAHKMYWNSFPAHWADVGSEFKDSKVDLFIRYFDTESRRMTEAKDWHTQRKAMYNIARKSIMWAYSSGEHYMQTIPFLALANTIKVYDSEGNEYKLYDIYQKEALDIQKKQFQRQQRNTLVMRDDKGNFYKHKDFKFRNGVLLHMKEIFDENTIMSEVNIRFLEKAFAHINNKSSFEEFTEAVDKDDQRRLLIPYEDGYLIGLPDEYLKFYVEILKDLGITSFDRIINNRKNIQTRLDQLMEREVWGVSDEAEFAMKAKEICDRLHGIYNNLDRGELANHWYGNMLLSMRGWLLGSIERIYAPNHYNEALGVEVEGNMISSFKHIMYVFGINKDTNKSNFWTSWWTLFTPWSKATKRKLLQNGFSPTQVANTNRTFYHFALIAILTTTRILLGGIGGNTDTDDKDKDESLWIWFLYYFVMRSKVEQAALVTANGISREVNTSANLMPVGGTAFIRWIEVFYLMGGSAIIDDKSDKRFYYQRDYQENKKGDPKWMSKMKKLLPFYKSIKFVKDPKTASENFEKWQQIKK